MSLPQLISSMLDPGIYPHPVDKVEVIQTHISYVLLAGAFTYKVKKPVQLGFLDFSSLEKRLAMCREEVRLNSRLAPDVYLDVLPIFQTDGPGVSFTPVSHDEPIEYAVKMRRLSERAMLPFLLQIDGVDQEMLAALARKLADFHALTPKAPAELTQDAFGLVGRNFEENFTQTRALIGTKLDTTRFEIIKHYATWFLRSNRALFEQRVAEDRVRECHGDLRMEHICFEDDAIIIFDCIEFNTRFRCIDTAEDLAFLLMDMEYQGYWNEAATLLKSYQEQAHDQGMPDLLTFFKCYYAMTRCKVFAIKSSEDEFSPEDREQSLKTALAYFDLAYAYAIRVEQPVLIIMCGLTGSGKSALAEALASRIGGQVFKSDEIRKDLAGITRTERHEAPFGQGIYSQDWTQKTYACLLEQGAQALQDRTPVVLDASFIAQKHRLLARQTAWRHQARFVCVQCLCPRETAMERLSDRHQEAGTVSDGRREIYEEQEAAFEPLTELEETEQIRVRTDEPLDRCAEQAVQALLDLTRD